MCTYYLFNVIYLLEICDISSLFVFLLHQVRCFDTLANFFPRYRRPIFNPAFRLLSFSSVQDTIAYSSTGNDRRASISDASDCLEEAGQTRMSVRTYLRQLVWFLSNFRWGPTLRMIFSDLHSVPMSSSLSLSSMLSLKSCRMELSFSRSIWILVGFSEGWSVPNGLKWARCFLK